MNEKIKKFFGFKRGLSDEFKEKIEDIIWKRVELLKDLKENEMLIDSTIKNFKGIIRSMKKQRKKWSRMKENLSN